MADDVGWFNIGVYNQGIMGTKTPNLDKLASQGMRMTDYYAEPSPQNLKDVVGPRSRATNVDDTTSLNHAGVAWFTGLYEFLYS